MKRKQSYTSYALGFLVTITAVGAHKAYAAELMNGPSGLIMIPYQAGGNHVQQAPTQGWRKPDERIVLDKPAIQNSNTVAPVVVPPSAPPIVLRPVQVQQPVNVQPLPLRRVEPVQPVLERAPVVVAPVIVPVPERASKTVVPVIVPVPVPEAAPVFVEPVKPARVLREADVVPPSRSIPTRVISRAPSEPTSTAPVRGVGMWHAAQHQTLDQVLADWGDKSGWKVVYNSRMIYELQAGADFDGDFVQASSALIKSIRATPQPLATFYKGNKALVITNSENQVN